MEDIEKVLKEWESSPDLQCNNCEVVFKGKHECNYDKLKEDNQRFKQLMEQYRFESELHKDLYEKVLAANKILGEALIIAYSHCDDNLMDETIDVIRMALDGEEVGELWADELKKGLSSLEESYK